MNTSAYTGQIDSLEPTLSNLAEQFAIFDEALLAEAQAKNASRIDKRQKLNQQAVSLFLNPLTQAAERFNPFRWNRS